MNFQYKIAALSTFCVGGGTKLIQSKLDGSNEIFSIPSYPLKYFYPHWKEWKKTNHISKEIVLKLILKHHASIIDTKKIPGFNGLRTLGKDKNKSLKISQKKFKYFFLSYLNKKKINSKNILIAIHYAYLKSKKINLKKLKYILYHIHEPREVSKNLVNDFKNLKTIFMCRDPINYFWKRMRNDAIIENQRFDKSDCIKLKYTWYLSSLINIFNCFDYIEKDFFKKNIFIKFEKLKKNQVSTLKKLCSNLGLKYKKNMRKNTFDGLNWWSSTHYKKKNPNKSKLNEFNYTKDMQYFFEYEIFVLEFLLFNYFKKFNYKTITLKKISFISFFSFFVFSLLPTKFGLKNLFKALNINNFIEYTKLLFKEIFIKKNLKNYYFNAMYKFKPQYNSLLYPKFNTIRKILYKNKKETNYNVLI